MKLRMLGLAVLLAASAAFGQASQEDFRIAREKLEHAEELYRNGDFDECLLFTDAALSEIEGGTAFFPAAVKAQFYKLRAFLSYAFREEGFKEKIAQYFLTALDIQPSFDIGSIEDVPPAVFDLFRKARTDYFTRYSRTRKRIGLGIFGALVLETTALSNPLLVQPGLHFGYNLDESFTLNLDLRFPLSNPLWDSIRGQVGVTWLPAYRVETISIGLAGYYKFSLDELSAFTHSISVGGHGEFVLRNGLGLSMYAELLRLDFVVDSSETGALLGYQDIVVSDFLRIVFSNLNVCILYTF